MGWLFDGEPVLKYKPFEGVYFKNSVFRVAPQCTGKGVHGETQANFSLYRADTFPKGPFNMLMVVHCLFSLRSTDGKIL